MPGRRLTLYLLQGVLVTCGAVATGTGLSVVARGAAAVPGGAPVSASVDSVLRFYALWWAAQGPVMWHLALRVDRDPARLAAVCCATFLGGAARALAAAQSGAPHPLFRALTVVELTVPPALLLLQRSLSQRPDRPSPH